LDGRRADFSPTALSIKIFGHDPVTLQGLADRVAEVLKTVPGAADVAAERLAGQPRCRSRSTVAPSRAPA
jgi:Cu/Ag efflux pump CusA